MLSAIKSKKSMGKKMVNFVWCKVCAQYKEPILSKVKGSAKTSALSFINGTNFVTRHSVMRHLNGGTGSGHHIVLVLERGKPKEQQIGIDLSNKPVLSQQSIVSLTKTSTKEGYTKLFRTAYELAMNPTISLAQFHTLVKVQRKNGVRLIEGHDDGKAAREFIHYIADTISEKTAAILGNSNFMSILTDGSQATKTGSEKGLVLIRTERNGIPVCFVASLLEMSEWGGIDANSLKNGMDSNFSDNGSIPLSENAYVHKVIWFTDDGASVNFERIAELMKRLSNGRDWLVTSHCVNHRVEIAVKDSFRTSDFGAVDEFYTGIFNLLKNSGKLKGEIKEAAKVLNIKHYVLIKITGTRFVGHRRKVYDRLLQIWSALIAAFENLVADRKTTKTTREKVNSYLEKLTSYKFLNMACCYADILESITPASKISETEHLMPYEVMPIVKETLAIIDDIIQADSHDLSHVALFTIGEKKLAAMFVRGDDNK